MRPNPSPAPAEMELTNGRLRLRPWQMSDAPALINAVHESLATVGQWLPWCQRGYSLADAATWIEHCTAGRASTEHFAFAVCDATTSELLGGVGLSQCDHVQCSANLGYWVRETRQRQGVAVAAATLLTRFGFAELELTRIEIVVLPENTASRATAAKLGARFEGVAKSRLLIDGHARDAATYSLLSCNLVDDVSTDASP